MKKKRYTLPEEQKDAAFAAEPAPAYHGNAAMTLPEDECAEEDLMNRSNKAEELAQYICNDAMNGSFNIGITGEWGTGKSTFLNMIKKNISKFKGTKDIYILQYDASTYSEQNQIWANFAKILFEEFEKQKIFSHIRYSLYKLFDNYNINLINNKNIYLFLLYTLFIFNI